LGGSEHKSRQLAAYFLHDFPVIADWGEDGYIYPWLPPGWRSLSATDASWWVRPKLDAVGEAGVRTNGSLAFSAMPNFFVSREQVTGGFGLEMDTSGWWVWSADRVVVRLRIHGKPQTLARLHFTCIAAAKPRELVIRRRVDQTAPVEQLVSFPEGWQEYVSTPFSVDGEIIEIEVSSNSPPVPLGGQDPRFVAFLVKNVRLEPTLTRP
jgi:hypothetical protein